MSNLKGVARRMREERFEALTARVTRGMGLPAAASNVAARAQMLALAEQYGDKLLALYPTERERIDRALSALRERCGRDTVQARQAPRREALTVGALRALLAHLSDDVVLIGADAPPIDPEWIAAAAKAVALVPPITRAPLRRDGPLWSSMGRAAPPQSFEEMGL